MNLKTILDGFSESIPIKTTKNIKIIKDVLVYLLVCDRLNVFVIAPPSVGAKSSMSRFFVDIIPDRFFLISGTGSITKAGVRDRIVEVGRRKGLLFFDEVHNAPPDVKKLLYDLLQFHRVQIIKKMGFRTITSDIQVYCNILATANPIDSYWTMYGDINKMKEQIPLDQVIMRRFHLVIPVDDYNLKEFGEICSDMGKNINKEELINKIETFIKASKEIEVIQKEIPKYVVDYLMKLKENNDYLLFPVTPELKVAITELAKGTARLSTLLNPKKYKEYVEKGIVIKDEHWKFAIEFFNRTLKQYMPENIYNKYFKNL